MCGHVLNLSQEHNKRLTGWEFLSSRIQAAAENLKTSAPPIRDVAPQKIFGQQADVRAESTAAVRSLLGNYLAGAIMKWM